MKEPKARKPIIRMYDLEEWMHMRGLTQEAVGILIGRNQNTVFYMLQSGDKLVVTEEIFSTKRRITITRGKEIASFEEKLSKDEAEQNRRIATAMLDTDDTIPAFLKEQNQ